MTNNTQQVGDLTRRLDHSVPDIAPEPETSVASLTRRLDHSVPDVAPEGTEI